jgi:hypothetical protein
MSWQESKAMKILVVSTLAFAVVTSAAFAGAPEASKATPEASKATPEVSMLAQVGPVELTDGAMDQVKAGAQNLVQGFFFGAFCGERCGANVIRNNND